MYLISFDVKVTPEIPAFIHTVQSKSTEKFMNGIYRKLAKIL
jgi:hypothetical protein